MESQEALNLLLADLPLASPIRPPGKEGPTWILLNSESVRRPPVWQRFEILLVETKHYRIYAGSGKPHEAEK
jgi:hypothetical protein